MRSPSRALAPLFLAAIAACSDSASTRTIPLAPSASAAAQEVDESTSRVVVDAGQTQGRVMRIEQASTHSTSSPLPSEATRAYLQGLDQDVVRTWIQVRYVYNKGNVDYNYKYAGSDVGAEDALRFYATTGKSVLIALSAYNPTSTWTLPTGDAFTEFLAQTLVYYKSKYPNIRYIQVGNEPDANDETMATYYPIYQQYYRAVNAANAQLGLDDANRILISNGPFTSNVPNMLKYADGFFAAYAADTDPAKKLDFFCFHSYGETNRPIELLTARQRIDDEMASHGLPPVPVFVDEYGMYGGSTSPARMTMAQLVTMQPAGQLTKAFYLYEGGIASVFNWAIYHASLPSKSQLADVETAIAYPYGNMLKLAHEVSIRETRIAAVSKFVDDSGLGTHVLASMHPGKGIAVLVWNFNWRQTPPEVPFDVLVKNIPHAIGAGSRLHRVVYFIDSKHNNYFTDKSQSTLVPTSEEDIDWSPNVVTTLPLERQGVALILLTRDTGKPTRP